MEVVNYQLLYLMMLVLSTVFITNLSIFLKSLSSNRRTSKVSLNWNSSSDLDALFNSLFVEDAWHSYFSSHHSTLRRFEVSDFYFNIVMMLLGMFMVIVGTYYNAGFDLLNLYAGVSITAVDYYPWAFLFLVGRTTVVLVNSLFSFLKLMD
ncbi:MAG: hypothetical protein ACPLZG_12695 [Thermoproteota archaeon]